MESTQTKSLTLPLPPPPLPFANHTTKYEGDHCVLLHDLSDSFRESILQTKSLTLPPPLPPFAIHTTKYEGDHCWLFHWEWSKWSLDYL